MHLHVEWTISNYILYFIMYFILMNTFTQSRFFDDDDYVCMTSTFSSYSWFWLNIGGLGNFGILGTLNERSFTATTKKSCFYFSTKILSVSLSVIYISIKLQENVKWKFYTFFFMYSIIKKTVAAYCLVYIIYTMPKCSRTRNKKNKKMF